MNRMAVTTLVRAAAALDAPLSFFLEGIGPQRQEPERPKLHGSDARVMQALAGIEDRTRRLIDRLITDQDPPPRKGILHAHNRGNFGAR